MKFSLFLDIMDMHESRHGTWQVKINWLQTYFSMWQLFLISEGTECVIKRYREEDGVFDGALQEKDGYTIFNIEDGMGDLEVVIHNKKLLLDSVFHDDNLQEMWGVK